MLEKISLTNWRSHANTHVTLTPGTNLFLGPMGSGKSSVVDALCFALYGTYPRLGRRDVSLEDVANFRHAGQTVAVEVEWCEDGEGGTNGGAGSGGAGGSNGGDGASRRFRVRRELAPAGAWIYIDNKLVQKGPKAVTEEVERILQIPYELFARAVYSEQNKLDYWLSLGPGSRKTELDRLLGLDHFETARGGAVSAIGRLKEQAAAMEAAAPAEKLEAAKAALEKRKQSLAAGQAEAEAAGKKREELEAELKQVQSKFEEGEKVEKWRQELDGERQKLNGTLSALEQSLATAPQTVSVEELKTGREWAKKERGMAEKEMHEAQTLEREATGKVGRLTAQMKSETERAKRAEQLTVHLNKLLEGRTLEALREEVKTAVSSLQLQLSQEAKLEGQLEDARKLLQALDVAGTQISEAGGSGRTACPVCQQPMDTLHQMQVKREQAAAIQKLGGQITEKKKAISSSKLSHEKLMNREAEASRLSAQLSALAAPAEADAWAAEWGGAQKMAEEQRQRAGACGERVRALSVQEKEFEQRIKQQEQVVKWRERRQQALVEKEGLEARLAAMQRVEGWAELVKTREDLMKKTAASASEQQSLMRLLESEKQLWQSAELVLAELDERRAAAQKLRAQMDELGLFRTTLLATQTQLRSLMLEQINAALLKLWPLLYPYGDWTGVRLVGGEKDYSVEIQQGHWMALEAHASGGERACLGLAMRSALAILLTPQLGWLILDEPTHNLDGHAVQQLGRALAEKVPQIIPQVIVITHESQLLESTPSRVTRFVRDKGRGEDTALEVE